MATFASLPASFTDCTAVRAMGAPSVTTWSMEESFWSLAVRVDFTEGMSVPLTYRFSVVPLKPFFRPAQRASRATWPCSWITQTACLAPCWLRRSPKAWPAMFSSWPKYSSMPSSFQLSRPELKPTTGMPAALALATTAFMASGLAAVRAMPSTFWSMAFCTRLAWFPATGSLE